MTDIQYSIVTVVMQIHSVDEFVGWLLVVKVTWLFVIRTVSVEQSDGGEAGPADS